MSKIFCSSKVKTYNPAIGEKSIENKEIRRQKKEGPVIRSEFIGEKYQDHIRYVTPSIWNSIVAFTGDIFHNLLEWSGKINGEMNGAQLEEQLFQNLRSLLIKAGGNLASEILRQIDTGFMGSKLSCPRCKGILEFRDYLDADFSSSIGTVRFSRAYYACSSMDCDYTVFPLDVKLGVTEHRMMPWVSKQLAILCEEMPYNTAVNVLKELTLNEISTSVRTAEEVCWELGDELKEIRSKEMWRAFDDPLGPNLPKPEGNIPELLVCSVDGTCVPTGKKEEYHEVKVGVVSEIVEYGIPNKDNDFNEPQLGNHSYTTCLGNADYFFKEFLMDCAIRGIYQTKKIVLMGDGAAWIWNRYNEYFGDLESEIQVVEILDFWHCVEHVGNVSRILYGQGTEEGNRWYHARKSEIYNGHLDEFFVSLALGEKILNKRSMVDPDQLKELQTEIEYFKRNKERIRYKEFRESGLPIGSGTVEGACKNIVKDRTNRSGMRWSVKGCDAILRLRALAKSNRWESFWQKRAKRIEEKFQQLKISIEKKKVA